MPDSQLLEPQKTPVLPGLRPYDEQLSAQFYGRSRPVEDLLSILQSSRFLGLTGPEGSGKTSLAMAGLLPALRSGFRGIGGETWRICHCEPGITPLENLAFALAGVAAAVNEGKASLELQHNFTTLLRADHAGLRRAIDRIGLAPGENLLIVFDQFESLFEIPERYHPGGGGAVDTDLLIGNIARMLSHAGIPVYVMCVINSEYIPSLYNFRNLHIHLSGGLYALPLFRQDDFNIIVTQGLASAHLIPDEDCLDHIRMSFGQDLRNLRPLQAYLSGIIDRFGPEGNAEVPKRLNAADLELVAPLDSAISSRLDAFHDALSLSDQQVMKHLFSHIVQPGEGAGMKRPQSVEEIIERRALDKPALENLLRAFESQQPEILSLTVPFDGQLQHFREPAIPESGVVNLGAAHAVRHWKRLHEWVAQEQEAETLYRRLSDAARLHALGQSGYLRPPDLDVFLQWWENFKPQPSWAAQFNTLYRPAQEYLQQSHDQHIEEMERRERERIDELRKARKRLLVGVIVAIMSVMLAAWAFTESVRAGRAREAAKQNEIKAKMALSEARKNEIRANDATDIALEEKEIARLARDSALLAKKAADEAKLEAVSNLGRAEMAERRALSSAREASRNAIEAANERDRARALARNEVLLKDIASRKAAYESAGKKILSLYNKATTGRFETPAERIAFIRDVSEAYQAYDSSSRLVNDGKVLPDRYLFDILSFANRQIKDELKGRSTVRQTLASTGREAGLRDIALWRRERIAAVGDQFSPIVVDRTDGKVKVLKAEGNDARLRAVSFADRDSLYFVNVRGEVFLSDLRLEKTVRLAKPAAPVTTVGGLAMAGPDLLTLQDGRIFALRRGGGPVLRKIELPEVSHLFESTDGVVAVTSRGLYIAPVGTVSFTPLAVTDLLHGISAVALHGDRLFAGNESGQVMFYRRTGPSAPFIPEWQQPVAAHRTRITALRFDVENGRLYTASLDRTSSIYDLTLANLPLIREHYVKLQGFRKWIWDFELVPGKPSAVLYSVDEQGELTSWVTNPPEMHAQIDQFLKSTGQK